MRSIRYLDSGAPPGRVTRQFRWRRLPAVLRCRRPRLRAWTSATPARCCDTLQRAARARPAAGARAAGLHQQPGARCCGCARKGRIEVGADADLVVLDADGAARDVIAVASCMCACRAGRCGVACSNPLIRPHKSQRSERKHVSKQGPPRASSAAGSSRSAAPRKRKTTRASSQRFVDLCGGADADIVVIPTASRLADTGARYEDIFSELGAGRVDRARFRHAPRRRGARTACERIGEATGIFFTGGNQLRLSTILGGTPVAKLIRARNARRRARRRHQRRRRILSAST